MDKSENQTETNTSLHSYSDWWDGKVHIMYSPCVFPKDHEPITGLDWNSFSNEDIQRIKGKQRELYTTELAALIDDWKKQFEDSFSRSELKDVLLQRELDQFYDIMFRQIPNQDRVVIGHKNLLFRHQDLSSIQRWITSVVINGDEISYDFVHSPNCPFADRRKKPDEIYANACWEYYKWLQTFVPKEEEVKDERAESAIEPYNTHIFKSSEAEKLFNDYCRSFSAELKIKPMALLSFIYWKLKDDELINNVTATQFRSFLATLPANYVLEKLKTLDKCQSADKVKIYEACKIKYFPEATTDV